MYLNGKMLLHKASRDSKEPASEQDKYHEIIQKALPFLKKSTLDFICVTFEVGYWRKANHIHNWFVNNIQEGQDDCREYEVSRKQLAMLLSICKELISNGNPDELLPTTSGFFFGGTEYNNYYFIKIKNTIDIIEYCLTLPDYIVFEYQSSW